MQGLLQGMFCLRRENKRNAVIVRMAIVVIIVDRNNSNKSKKTNNNSNSKILGERTALRPAGPKLGKERCYGRRGTSAAKKVHLGGSHLAAEVKGLGFRGSEFAGFWAHS